MCSPHFRTPLINLITMLLVLLLLILLLHYIFLTLRQSTHATNRYQLNAAIIGMSSATLKKLQIYFLWTPHKQEPNCLTKRLINQWKINKNALPLHHKIQRIHSSIFLSLSQVSTRFWKLGSFNSLGVAIVIFLNTIFLGSPFNRGKDH